MIPTADKIVMLLNSKWTRPKPIFLEVLPKPVVDFGNFDLEIIVKIFHSRKKKNVFVQVTNIASQLLHLRLMNFF